MFFIFRPVHKSFVGKLKDVVKNSEKGYVYHKRNLVNIIVFPQFLIFQKNNSAET